ncbi:MAG: riboflavin synthase [Proteobacteria bacterium]|nr:riboflavin synthase [Pseudomonadota bacterium]
MFTGIVTDLGRVRRIERGGDTRVEIATGYDTVGIAIGASIACSGACLTAIETGPGWFAVEVSAETFACTNLGAWTEDSPVNLERSLALSAELGGHIVLGHVDGLAKVESIEPEGDSLRFVFAVPAALARFIAAKGSVALDGVSLTVNVIEDLPDGRARFGVNVIPHTQAVTTFGAMRPGHAVNLEVDLLARYTARLMERE